jgi:hypothetical protein
MKREVVRLVCDLCQLDEIETDGVETRRLRLDRNEIECEVCHACWVRAVKHLLPLVKSGRQAKHSRTRTRTRTVSDGAVRMPGTDWRFTSHALERIGERRLDPVRVVEVADHPAQTRPSTSLVEAMVHECNDVHVVVIASRKIIITAAGRDQAIDREAAVSLVGKAAS